jgi:hypothetical protein
MMTEIQLLEAKEKVDKASREVSELTGEQTALLKQLKEELGCKTLEEAKAILKTKKRELDKIDEEIEKLSEELESKYEL